MGIQVAPQHSMRDLDGIMERLTVKARGGA